MDYITRKRENQRARENSQGGVLWKALMAGYEVVVGDTQDPISKWHHIVSWLPEEESLVLMQNGRHLTMPMHEALGSKPQLDFKTLFLPSSHSTRESYRYLKRYIQLFQNSHENKELSHWVLKSPSHALYHKALLKEFPDAHLVVSIRVG